MHMAASSFSCYRMRIEQRRELKSMKEARNSVRGCQPNDQERDEPWSPHPQINERTSTSQSFQFHLFAEVGEEWVPLFGEETAAFIFIKTVARSGFVEFNI